MKIAAHRLLIKNPKETLDFYQNALGMKLIKHGEVEGRTHYYLSYNSKQATLELIHSLGIEFTVSTQPSVTEGYWKFTIAVDDLDSSRDQLIKRGVSVESSFEVKELAYLCHLTDPNGYCIELVQKTNKTPLSTNVFHSGHSNSLNLSTLRVKDAAQSLNFYRSIGMDLAYTYRSDERKMTLYFLAPAELNKELNALSKINLEERLWQSSHTLLELQQLDKVKGGADIPYHVGYETGFLGLDLAYKPSEFSMVCEELSSQQQTNCDGQYVELTDPDGYKIRILST
ncbi:VOC family protein [Vibrio astriarenae]|uniref:VOC family protein n=1 Tax=Vibrio astriarenae TaxID=1481923 RepID=UPI0037355262